jgi:hypothetical protein
MDQSQVVLLAVTKTHERLIDIVIHLRNASRALMQEMQEIYANHSNFKY